MNREVLRLRDSTQAARELNGAYGVTLNLQELAVEFNGRNSLMAIAVWAASQSSALPGLAQNSQKLRGSCGDWTESRSWQVVGISLEDAISRKAIGSPH